MNTHVSTPRSPSPAAVATHPSLASNESAQPSAHSAWTTRRSRSIADLVDDQDALEDWHRNLARLRADLQD